MKKKAIVFVTVNFAITWALWISLILFLVEPLSTEKPGYIIYGLGGLLGPVLAAFFAQSLFGSGEEFRTFLKQLINIKAGLQWHAFIIAIPFLSGILPYLTEWILGGNFYFEFHRSYLLILMLLPMMLIGGGLEELGWRGVLLPELLKKYSVLQAVLYSSIIWAVWHAPLWFIEGTPQYGSNFGIFLISIVGAGIFLSVLYIKTRSIALCVLFHAFLNANAFYFIPEQSFSPLNETISALVKLFISLGILYFAIKPGIQMIPALKKGVKI